MPGALRLTSFIIILLMVAAVASILVNATGPDAADPLSYTTGRSWGHVQVAPVKQVYVRTGFACAAWEGIAIAACLEPALDFFCRGFHDRWQPGRKGVRTIVQGKSGLCTRASRPDVTCRYDPRSQLSSSSRNLRESSSSSMRASQPGRNTRLGMHSRRFFAASSSKRLLRGRAWANAGLSAAWSSGFPR